MRWEIIHQTYSVGTKFQPESPSLYFIPLDETSDSDGTYSSRDYDYGGEALFTKFELFINRASNCQNIFAGGSNLTTPPIHQSQPKSSSPPASKPMPRRQVILLEDLPNLLHFETQTKFHAALQSLVRSPMSNPPVPVIVVVSDVGIRGEASDERMISGGGWGKNKDGVVDIRTVLSRDLLGGPYVTSIGYVWSFGDKHLTYMFCAGSTQ
jgi:cell cycle checkpoint protein